MNKKILFIGILITLLLLLTYDFSRTREITELYSNNVNDIESIKIMNGTTGDIKEYTDIESI
ncbi:MAG: hypothetical protein PUC65_13490 [Clostridiales bacterium]|nr:hypothetical protein [Clostridiales bacterium]